MSKSFVRIQTDNIQELNNVPDGTIVALLDPNNSVSDENVEGMVLPCFDDPRIGFVYTDFLVESGDMTLVEFLNGSDLPDCPFFFKKIAGVVPQEVPNVKSNLMQQLVSKGYYFEHIADPIVVLKE